MEMLYLSLYSHSMSSQGIFFNKTRIAPTPSGFLHLGNVFSFAITASLARKTQAKILLRIDDLDRERVQQEYVQDIFDTLHFLDIPWEEGPADYAQYEREYSQLHRITLYQKALQQLAASGQVFACNCSRAQLLKANAAGIYTGTCLHKGIPLDTPQVNWRLDTTHAGKLDIKTLSGIVTADLPPSMRHFVIRKKDGFPAYQLTSIIDDAYFGIDLVVRGEDLWPSTLAQHYLATRLQQQSFLNSTFYHHPLLLETGGEKLSKSAGSTSIQYLRKQGKQPKEIYAMIAQSAGIHTPVINWEDIGFTSVSSAYGTTGF